jgi:signal transduction histidine kinase
MICNIRSPKTVFDDSQIRKQIGCFKKKQCIIGHGNLKIESRRCHKMNPIDKPFKPKIMIKPVQIGLISMLIIVITLLHYGTLHGKLATHIPHRELYFIPILLASFWFGLSFGLVTSLTVSLIYAPHVFVHSALQGNFLPVVFQIVVFNLVALMLGWLTERGKRQQKKLIVVEKLVVLGRAAVAVGHEMKDLLGALKAIAGRIKESKDSNVLADFKNEMRRLEKMVDILSAFESSEHIQLFSHDVNETILNRIDHHQKLAKKSGITIEAHLDDYRCPSQVNIETVGRAIDKIIENALEVSSSRSTLYVRSERHGDNCRVEIKDEGPGIKPEHLSNIFKPFFTTKEMGQGLALASCRKSLRDMGGDIEVKSEYGQGATFIITVPREYSGKLLAADPISTVIKGEKVEGIYRD